MPATTAIATGHHLDEPTVPRRPLWPRLLAVAVVAQPLLIAVNATFHPEVDLSGQGLLRGASESPTTWYAVHVAAALGALLGAPAAVGLRRLVTGRGRRPADGAVVASLVAAALLAMSFAAEASVLRLAAGAGLDERDALALAEAYGESPEFYAVGLGAFAAVVAGVLFGIALLRERRVPRWMAATLLVGSLATAVAAPGTPVGPVAFGVVAVASAGLARRVAAGARDQ